MFLLFLANVLTLESSAKDAKHSGRHALLITAGLQMIDQHPSIRR